MTTTTNTNWPLLNHFFLSFLAGLITLFILYWIVWIVIYYLRKRGDILEDFKKEAKSIGLSTRIAFIEQFLFFIAAIAGKEVFGLAVTGWLVFKGIHQWARWESSKTIIPEIPKRVKKAGLTKKHYSDAIVRNRFMVFLIGTGMSIAAGGISGVVYHYIIWFQESYSIDFISF